MERDPESVPGDVSTKSARVEMTVQSTMQYHCCELMTSFQIYTGVQNSSWVFMYPSPQFNDCLVQMYSARRRADLY